MLGVNALGTSAKQTVGVAFLFFLALTLPCGAVDIWITAGDKSQLLKQQTDVVFLPGAGSGGTPVSVVPSTTYQTISGFGAAMTDSSAWLLQNELTQAQRDKLMTQLFSPTAGIGINYLRVPLGASDFTASGFYSYNDNPSGGTDELQAQFSIAHDEAYIIPRLQQALALNPELQLMGTPWSAPGWMKTNGSLVGNGATLKTQWEASYALYLAKAVEAYAEQGLPFDTLTLQNEPLHTTNYPTMAMSATQQARIIKEELGPLFAAKGVATKILAYDHNWDNTFYPIQILDDPEANQYVAGSAFHAYGGDVTAQSTVHDAHPDKDIYFTEITGGDWATDFGDNLVWNFRNIFNGSVRNWSKTALLWNLALDQNNGPHLNGCSNCRGVVTINSTDGDITFNEEFYSIGQVTKAVQPNAVRILSTTYANGIDTVAYANPDGSHALVALNPSSSASTIRVVESGQHFEYQIPGKSVATFLWDSQGADFDNGGFDDGGFQVGGGSLDAWNVFGNASGNVAASDLVALSGEKSLSLSGQFNGLTNTSGVSQGITVEGGDTVTALLSALVRSADSLAGTNNFAEIKIEFYDFFGAAYGSANYLGELTSTVVDANSVSDQWLEAGLSGLAPVGAVEARLVLQFVQSNNTPGAVHLDAVQFAVQPPAPIAGDFDGDGDVDEEDRAIWQQAYASSSLGDADGDDDSDGVDFLLWQRNLSTQNGQHSIAIPEPGWISLSGICGMLWLLWGQRYH